MDYSDDVPPPSLPTPCAVQRADFDLSSLTAKHRRYDRDSYDLRAVVISLRGVPVVRQGRDWCCVRFIPIETRASR